MKPPLVTGDNGVVGAAICAGLAQGHHHIVVHAHGNVDCALAAADTVDAADNSPEAISAAVTFFARGPRPVCAAT